MDLSYYHQGVLKNAAAGANVDPAALAAAQQWQQQTQGTRDVMLEAGEPASTLGLGQQQSEEIGGNLSVYNKFGMALMDILKKYQGMGTSQFQQAAYSGVRQQSERVLAKTPQELIGAHPSLQAGVRSAEAQAMQPQIEGAQKLEQTFSEQLSSFGSALSQAAAIGQWMEQVETTKRQESQAIVLNPAYREAILSMPDKERKELFKRAGISEDFFNAMPATTGELKYLDLGNRYVAVDETGKEIMSYAKGLTPSAAGGGVGTITPGATITYEQLSPTAKMVVDGVYKLSDITPTMKQDIAPELVAYGFTYVMANEDKQTIATIRNGMADVMESWKKVPQYFKGFIEGYGGRLIGGNFDENVKKFEADVGIIGMQLTRLFEKGRISDQDRQFYMSLMPNLMTGSEKVAQAGADELVKLLEAKMTNQLDELEKAGVGGASGSNDQQLENEYYSIFGQPNQ